MKKQIMDIEGLVTLMWEVEDIINARPLTKAFDDSKDMNAPTQNHLLIVKSNQNFPSGVFNKSGQYSQHRWCEVQ